MTYTAGELEGYRIMMQARLWNGAAVSSNESPNRIHDDADAIVALADRIREERRRIAAAQAGLGV